MKVFFLFGILMGIGVFFPLEAQPTSTLPAAERQAGKFPITVPQQQRAREVAELVYNTFRLSLIRGNEQAWRSCTSTARQVKVRNLIVSQRGTFPQDFFRQPHEVAQLENFQYVGALSGCGGKSLAVTYLGKIQLGTQGQAHHYAYVLEFIFEGGKWKLDQTRLFNLAHLPDVRKKLIAQDISVLKDQDGFHPYSQLPAIPANCPPPQLIGKVFVDAPGRDIQMTINGISPHDFGDERRADVISGGLKRGRNTISYTIRTDEKKPHPSMAIGLFVMPETPGNHPICVFDHILDAHDEAHGGTFTFMISNEQIASMNPKFQGEKPQPFHATPLKQKTQPVAK